MLTIPPHTIGGSLTQSQTKISAVNGTSFVDFGIADLLTVQRNRLLKIYDSTGKKIEGWIKASGSGETLDSEIIVNGAFAADTDWSKEVAQWTISDGKAHAISCATNKSLYQGDGSGITAGALYKESLSISGYSAGGVQSVTGAFTSALFNSNAVNSFYFTGTALTSITENIVTVGITTLDVDNVSKKKVLTPSATGVTIVSTQGGTTYNWASIESGFNYNSTTFTYEIVTDILSLESKSPKWAFYIYDKNGVGYSFVTEPLGGTIGATGITLDAGLSWDDGTNLSSIVLTDFGGITLNRNLAENTVIAPSEVTFNISNPENAFDFLDFKGGTVFIELYVSDGLQDVKITGWEFRIKTANPGYQNLKITAQDLLQYYLTGYYPNTRLPEDIFPSNRTYSSDGLCVPVPFGTAYVPLRDVYISGQGGFIMLGDPAYTYALSAIRSPRAWGLKTEYLSSSYTFTQATKADADAVNWRVFQAIIADSNSDGTADAAGFWGTSGGNMLDPPVKFTRSDTATMTNPADVISFILKDFGIPATYIDESVTFAAAKATFATWGLTCNGAFWYKQEREKVLASLLTQCHACLRVGEKIELHILSKTSKKTITGAEVLRTSEQGEGSFSYSDIVNTDLSDSGYVAWQAATESQDEFTKTLVAVGTTATVISKDVLEVPFVQDSENVKRIGVLHFQRKYLKEAEASFAAKGVCLALQPDDVITIDADNYGGTYTVLIDSVKINPDISIAFSTSKYTSAFQDWEDLTVVPLN